MDTPKTLVEAITLFSNPAVAHAYFAQVRWPNGVACPRMGCGNADVREITGRRPRWFCRECKREFTAKVGTIFEDSPIGFDKWLPAIWMISADRNGISSYEIHRALGVTQKTAWFMLHRIRLGFISPTYARLTGHVEADEAYIGGEVRNNKRLRAHTLRTGESFAGKVAGDKTAVFGIVERKGEARAWVVPDTRSKTLLPKLYDAVHHEATLYTDSAGVYKVTGEEYFDQHQVINHAIGEYVRGNVHTNNIEGFWSVLKRTIKGTYIAPRPFHLQRYVEEQVFRFNARHDGDGARFKDATKGADGKRLTYKALTTTHPRWRLKPGRADRSPLTVKPFRH
jgi:transposase-like protein